MTDEQRSVIIDAAFEIGRLRTERDDFAARLQHLASVVNQQAEDDGLWFMAETAPEDYLQRGLRHLHAEIEKAWPTKTESRS